MCEGANVKGSGGRGRRDSSKRITALRGCEYRTVELFPFLKLGDELHFVVCGLVISNDDGYPKKIPLPDIQFVKCGGKVMRYIFPLETHAMRINSVL